LKFQNFVLLSHDEGILASLLDDLSDFIECPGFGTKIGRMDIDEHLNMVIITEGKHEALEAYSTENFNALLTQMFSKTGAAPGLKVNKIQNGQHVKMFKSGLLYDTVHILAASPKSFLLFQWLAQTKNFKKINEFPQVDAGNTTSISFLYDKFCVSIGNKFYLLSPRDGSLKELVDSSLPSSRLDASRAITSFYTSENRVLLCYESIGILMDISTKEHKAEKYFLWKTLGCGFGYQAPYLIAFCNNIIEIWNVNTGQLRQMIHAPDCQPLDAYRSLFSQADGDTKNVVATLKLAKQ
jgi:hypothetical protein